MTCAAVASPDEDSNIASDGAFTLATTSPSRLKGKRTGRQRVEQVGPNQLAVQREYVHPPEAP